MKQINFLFVLFIIVYTTNAQKAKDSILSIDRIYNSSEFNADRQRPIFWINGGNAFVTIERSEDGDDQLVKYLSSSNEKSIYLSSEKITPENQDSALRIENFSLSPDETQLLIFTNSSRVWRSNTKGDYWVYDFETGKLRQLGHDFPSSSLMFAKFSNDNASVAYVQDFDIYAENFETGEVKRLTFDGNGKIINGTFDWVYEEEFGMRDGFTWSPNGSEIAFWQLDASEIGTFYMINNTDSVYSKPIPLQYPKVGFNPSSAKVGVVNMNSGKINLIPVPGDPVQHYLPAVQWINEDMLLIQQLNRKQNQLSVFTYQPSSKEIKKIYTETEKTWIDLRYPDISSNQWGNNNFLLTDNNTSFLRMTETDGWRHIYKVNIKNGEKTLLTPGNYDVATYYTIKDEHIYFSASPQDPAQRYLYSVTLDGSGNLQRLTPESFDGVNTYNISPNGKFAIHSHTNTETPRASALVDLPNHQKIKDLASNIELQEKLNSLKLPNVEFFQVNTSEGIEVEGRLIKPADFDPSKKYPVLFHVYGEPWGQMATDTWIGLFNIFMTQQGFVVINLDNRGTPSLKGSEWRKSIYRKVGIVNTDDQALAASEVLKWDFIDNKRVSVWGWSGGGSMTLNLMFKYPEIYGTGVAVASVANQLLYNNIYQERYMGLPEENLEDFIEGSPATHAGNLEGNLLIIHGTGDDNVHYQNMDYLVNELIKQNKQFEMMSYPNRSHGIYEGSNTQRHLYTLITNYLLRHNSQK